ncbi:MAG TPA: hypothetical protein VMT45_15295 [Thermoanaerobaculaceae bacterium]|nr:hypothetical protein [Thermoanaerobaculaceae bacterium]
MRNRQLFWGLILVGLAGLLAAPAAMATGGCSSFTPTVEVIAGPCPVASATPSDCAGSGDFTGIKYRITGNVDYIATVVTANNIVVSVPANQFYAPCAGDPVLGLGQNSCHERAVKVAYGSLNNYEFWLVVQGKKAPVLQSIALKKGFCSKSFAVTGLGFNVNPFQAAQRVETINFKGCAWDFTSDSLTGEVVSTQFNESQSTLDLCSFNPTPPCCSGMIVTDVAKLSLKLDTASGLLDLGSGQFGEGYVSSGINSCTTRVIGGKVYTWGSPCP